MDIDDPSDMPSDSNGLSHSAISKYSLQSDDPMLDTTQGIPDEALIAAAKAKRKAAYGQKVVSGGGVGGEDYISITEQSGRLTVYDADAGTGGRDEPHPESRLQREEDELGEGDEGGLGKPPCFGLACRRLMRNNLVATDLAAYTGADEKLTLGKSANAAAARRLRNDIVEAIDEREMEDVDDEDEMEWEMAQASRANVRPEKVSTSLDKVSLTSYQTVLSELKMYDNVYSVAKAINPPPFPQPAPYLPCPPPPPASSHPPHSSSPRKQQERNRLKLRDES